MTCPPSPEDGCGLQHQTGQEHSTNRGESIALQQTGNSINKDTNYDVLDLKKFKRSQSRVSRKADNRCGSCGLDAVRIHLRIVCSSRAEDIC